MIRPAEADGEAVAARQERLLALGHRVVEASEADETEVVLTEGRVFLTRFARNRIHQNVGTAEASAVVRVVVDKRVGVAVTESLDPEALASARTSALEAAEASEPDPSWPGLPPPRPVRPVEAYDPATAGVGPDERAEFVTAVVAAARQRGGEAAGYIQTLEGARAVVSSRGVAVAESATQAEAVALVTCEDGSGWAEAAAMRFSDLDAGRLGRRAALVAEKSRRPRPIEPGVYDVVLEPSAVAEWIQYLAYVALSGKDFEEGRSPLAGRLGRPVTGTQVSIWDNPRDRRTLRQAFDFEGQPTRRLSLIRRGVAEGVGTNYYRARRLGRRVSTGHALPANSSMECLPTHLFMKGGRAGARELVAGLERGLLITRFHYTNVLDPMTVRLTGMTRDGTFLVERGRIVHPVRNLRYTEDVLEALGRIDGLARRLVLVPGPCVVPAVRIRGVHFTGTTEF